MNALLVFLTLTAAHAYAGGSFEDALIRRLVIDGKDFSVVFVPSKEERFSDISKCRVFTVVGTFDRSKWIENHKHGPNLESHMSALAHLRQASKSKAPIKFGYMGTGYSPIEKSDPCVVESNGLELLKHKDKKFEAVISFYD